MTPLDFSLYKKPLVDLEKMVFTRGYHEFKTVEEVAEEEPYYILWIINSSETDRHSKDILTDFVENHPGYFEEE